MEQISPGWAVVALRDVLSLEYGKALSASQRNQEGRVPVYGSAGVVGSHDTHLVVGPGIVVGRKGAAGNVVWAPTSFWTIDTAYHVRHSEFLDSKFVYYLLKSLRLDQLDKSTAIPSLSRDDVYPIEVGLPPLSEQRRIVAKIEELFSELDKGVESLKTAREQLKVYRQAVLKDVFEGKLSAKQPSPPERSSGLAEGWRQVRLYALIDKPRYGTSRKCGYDTPGTGVIRIPNIGDGVLDTTDLKFASFDRAELDALELQRGDILSIRSNGSLSLVGKCALVTPAEEKFIFAGYLVRIRPRAVTCPR